MSTQLAPNVWQSIVDALVLWQFKQFALSINKFRHVFSIFNNPKADSGWLYFKARLKRTLLGRYPSNVKGWKKKFFFISGDNWEFAHGLSRKLGVLRILRSWSTPHPRSVFI